MRLIDGDGLWERLNYEPWEHNADRDEIALKLMRLADLESLCSYDHLRELAEADKEGRVVVLEMENRHG